MTNIHRLSPPRGIDHLVIAGHDLSALAELYRRLGFTVGRRNQHPWGTENHIVQFPGCFLELIGIGDASLIPERSGRNYSFGGFLRDFLAGDEGMAMLVLESRNAVGDAEEFRKNRIGHFEPFFFERQGQRADGTTARVAFTLAFAEAQGMPRAGFFACQQHEPQNFWNPAAQQHANGVAGIERVTMVADDPSDLHEFLGTFIGQREMRATSFGIELDTGRGLVEVLTREAFRFRFGADPQVDRRKGPQFAAITFRTPDLDRTFYALSAVHLPFGRLGGKLVFSALNTHGVVIAFSAD